MADNAFCSDRTAEAVTNQVRQGLITRRIDDGSFAMEFPARHCADLPDAITGTDRDLFCIRAQHLDPRTATRVSATARREVSLQPLPRAVDARRPGYGRIRRAAHRGTQRTP